MLRILFQVSTQTLRGERFDLRQDRRSVSAMLAGIGDNRSMLFNWYESSLPGVDYEQQAQGYATLELKSYLRTRWLPQALRGSFTRILLALHIATMVGLKQSR
ncbi:hypothetical protein [Janthinobacterium sp. PC23-8]|uniref:hypothetical protein n=1 Tax=Janthinobacterium sp. PC23-8 TaxID=2012679 RepID=UPI000B960422|nr:hypothetical protein [Janthinobacterium sp. PC23-8]OYO32056.1 hypothetical protein CD932_13685 [Janthinobacterium sp. PC23-8]